MSARIALDHCPLCERDAASAELLYAGPPGGVGIRRCGGCGLAFATAFATTDELVADYGARAERDVDEVAAAAAGGRERPGITRKRARVALYDRLSHGRIGRPHPGSRALDIGCNNGLLLDVLAGYGYATAGLERSPAAAQAIAAGHRILQTDLEGADDLGDRFDLITLTHVLEHLRRPVAALRWIARHLAPGGLVVIEVPNFADAARPLWGLRYRALELGDHLSFFERATLEEAIARAGLGLVELWSAPQASTMVFPSLLSGLDVGLAGLRRLRPRRAPAAVHDLGARARGGGRVGRVVEPLLGALDRADPWLEERFGAACPWGANLVAIVGAG